MTPSRLYSWGYRDGGSFCSTVALLAIADGTAVDYADLPGIVARAHAVRRNRTARDEWGALLSDRDLDESRIASELRPMLGRLRMLSAPGSYGVITDGTRAVARAALA